MNKFMTDNNGPIATRFEKEGLVASIDVHASFPVDPHSVDDNLPSAYADLSQNPPSQDQAVEPYADFGTDGQYDPC